MLKARHRSWWQKIWQRRVAIAITTVVIVVAIVLIMVGYRFDWTGFNGSNKSGKTLWDWMQLLFIPVVLAVAGFRFNHRERKAAEFRAEAEREIAMDNQMEAALQAYINSMSELLLHEKLRESAEDDEVRKISRVRTLTVLPHLDMRRKKSVLQFLYESNLIDNNKCIVNLHDANLRGADLREVLLGDAILTGAEMYSANLARAKMPGANLRGADLSYANLSKADLRRADFEEADLSGANLEAAKIVLYQLDLAKSLKGATMPDGSIHP